MKVEEKPIESYEEDVFQSLWKTRPQRYRLPYGITIGPFDPGGYEIIDMRKDHPEKWTLFKPFSLKQLGSCGAIEIYSSQHVLKYSKKRFLQFLSNYFHRSGCQKPKEHLGDGLQGEHSTWTNGGILIAIANADNYGETQRLYKKWLKKVGFEHKQTFFNHIHGHELELFTFQLPPDLHVQGKWTPEVEEVKEAIAPPKTRIRKKAVGQEAYI